MTDNRLRWAVPVGIVTTVAAVVGFSQIAGATDAPDLPKRTASQLLVDLRGAQLDALSGTVVQRADLGLPAFAAAGGGSDFTSLVSGNHTLKVWYAGPDKVRLALLGTLGESDVIRNGDDLWLWSSKDHKAVHSKVTGEHKSDQGPLDPQNLPKTPQEAADRLLATIDPSTVVTTASNVTVAGRAAYDLILAPRDKDSLIGSVHVAVDGERHVPLRVQVFAKGTSAAAFEVGFQQISFEKPGAEHFQFTPPPGTEKSEAPAAPGPSDLPPVDDAAKPVLKGTGWTTVVVAKPGTMPKDARGILGQLPKVSGDWGSGRLLSSKLFSALLTDDGRVIVGAVAPAKLYEAAK
ncbi:hypothetical protein AB0M43_08630 [Longispora sp. NPDC051575]|uniref:LolA family protein n=1 Tax=Longispora sp. NPDC051575 TaxID=3154943 RepID=UPI00343920E5